MIVAGNLDGEVSYFDEKEWKNKHFNKINRYKRCHGFVNKKDWKEISNTAFEVE